jgi:transposase
VALLIVEADMPRRKSPAPKVDQATAALLQTLNPHAAGIDLSDDEHWVCVPEGAVSAAPPPPHDSLPSHVRRFGACTADLRALVAWLRQAGVDTVAMEATGVYWVPLYDLLEAEGFRVLLVDPHQTRAVPGRPKTDVKDCRWIQRLHSLGLLSAAFRPDEPIRVLRSYQRHRASLVEDASRFILRMQKALEQMNIKLTEVLADITGVTGLAILKAILAGERDPVQRARLRQRGCKHDEAGIARALEGSWRAEHLFALPQSLDLSEYYQQQIAACDRAIEAHLKTLARPEKPAPLPARGPGRKRRGNEPHFDARQRLYEMAGVDLTAIEGIEAGTALVVLSEVGTDMSRWRSEKAFGSWLGLAPNPKKSGRKVKAAATRAGEPCGQGAAAGGTHPAAVAERFGGLLPADRGAARGAQGDRGDGLQAGAARLRAAQARRGVRDAGAGSVRGGVPGPATAAVAEEGSGTGLRADGAASGRGGRKPGLSKRGVGLEMGRGEEAKWRRPGQQHRPQCAPEASWTVVLTECSLEVRRGIATLVLSFGWRASVRHQSRKKEP